MHAGIEVLALLGVGIGVGGGMGKNSRMFMALVFG